MPTENTVLLSNARASLNGKWGLASGTLLVYVLLTALPVALPFASFLVVPALSQGFTQFSLSLARGQDAKLEMLFKGTKSFGTVMGTYFLMRLLSGLWVLALTVAVVTLVVLVFIGLQSSPMKNANIDALLLLAYLLAWPWVGSLCLLAALFPGLLIAFSYSMTPFILADNPTISPEKALKMSKSMMAGNKRKFFQFCLHFNKWALLSLLTLGIGFLWLVPYMVVCLAHFYNDIKGAPYDERSEQDRIDDAIIHPSSPEIASL